MDRPTQRIRSNRLGSNALGNLGLFFVGPHELAYFFGNGPSTTTTAARFRGIHSGPFHGRRNFGSGAAFCRLAQTDSFGSAKGTRRKIQRRPESCRRSVAIGLILFHSKNGEIFSEPAADLGFSLMFAAGVHVLLIASILFLVVLESSSLGILLGLFGFVLGQNVWSIDPADNLGMFWNSRGKQLPKTRWWKKT